MNTMKEKQNAVMTLLEGSVLLSYEQKLDLVENFPLLDEAQIDALGSFLSSEEKIREAFGEDIQEGVGRVLTNIVGESMNDDKTVFVGVGKASQ